ncbi:hypothetical protein [Hugenholtzia roseola]|uniref:hypothetical protein n=1 Tax=Hugenholtzia roseola TaxID=1002 RepID=UPI000423F6FF|nr:hypothetical protein [Hugenholtzia roseola]
MKTKKHTFNFISPILFHLIECLNGGANLKDSLFIEKAIFFYFSKLSLFYNLDLESRTTLHKFGLSI